MIIENVIGEIKIEKIGIDIAKRSLGSADLVFAVFDGGRALSSDDMKIVDMCRGKNAVAVINKADMEIVCDADFIKNNLKTLQQ